MRWYMTYSYRSRNNVRSLHEYINSNRPSPHLAPVFYLPISPNPPILPPHTATSALRRTLLFYTQHIFETVLKPYLGSCPSPNPTATDSVRPNI
jgi:hypothetical protein